MDDYMQQAKFLTALLGDAQENAFRMEWEGSKIPRGATINGVEVGWTQHGRITGKAGEELGFYDRELECGGTNGKAQVMIVKTEYKDVTPPPGGKVEPVVKASGQVRT